MSRSAVESHKGDRYQNLLAAQYIAEMMDEKSGQKIVRMEIESTRVLDGDPIEVEDFIIHHESGRKTYCQCKKNQTARRDWTIHGLGEELNKAWNLFKNADDIESIDFYCQNGFGDLGKLAEESRSYPDVQSFIHTAINNNATINSIYQKLKEVLDIQGEDTELWEFLKTLSFRTIEQETIRECTLLHLSSIATNANAALDAVLELVAKANAREKKTGLESRRTDSSFITRQDVLKKFSQNGICLAPWYPIEILREEIQRISAIGRSSFLREIGGERIPRPEVKEILQHLDDGSKTMLLEGGPGAGKSCVLLNLVDQLEQDPDAPYNVIYLQTKEFDDLGNGTDRISQELGYDFPRKIARFAECHPVIVAMDSLDVIAISTGGAAFRYFFALIDQLRNIPNIFIVASCRTFDAAYDSRLRAIPWEKRISVKPWDWKEEIVPLFEKWGWNASQVGDRQKCLLSSPYMLWIYHELRQQGMVPTQSNDIDLLSGYLKFSLNEKMGEPSRKRIEKSLHEIALRMLARHRMEIMEEETELQEEDIRILQSLHILEKSGHSNLRFGHQTYLDLILVRNAIRQGKTLSAYAGELPPVPFVRPIVRTYFFYLRSHNSERFRQELRGLLDSSQIAFHLKRLMVSSLAEVIPEPNDQALVRYLFQSKNELFLLFFRNIKQYEWFLFLRRNWFDAICQSHDESWLGWMVHQAGEFYEFHPKEITDFWLSVLEFPWPNQESLKENIISSLEKHDIANINETFPLLKNILSHPYQDEYVSFPVEQILMKMPKGETEKYDDLLFSWVANGYDHHLPECLETLQKSLRCSEKHFSRNHDFLENAIKSSSYLLGKCLDHIIQWVNHLYGSEKDDKESIDYCLSEYGDLTLMSHEKNFSVFIILVRKACMEQSAQEKEWWTKKLPTLMQEVDKNPALMFIVISSLLINPEKYLTESKQIIRYFITQKHFFFLHESSQLLKQIVPYLDEAEQYSIIDPLFDTYQNSDDPWQKERVLTFLDIIPQPWKTQKIITFIDIAKRGGISPHLCLPADADRILGGYVPSAVPTERFLCFSENEVLRVLKHFHDINYQTYPLDHEDPHIQYQLQKAISMAPTQFDYLWKKHWTELDDQIHNAVLGGLADHLHYLYGHIRADKWKAREKPEAQEIANEILSLIKKTEDFSERTIASALEASSLIVFEDEKLYQEIINYLKRLINYIDPYVEEVEGINIGRVLNSPIGSAIQAAFILFEKKRGKDISPEHMQLLRDFALMENPSIKAFYIDRMLPLLNNNRKIAWELFNEMVTDEQLYGTDEVYRFLYYCYHREIDLVIPHLKTMHTSQIDSIGKSWGQLEALCYLDNQITKDVFEEEIVSARTETSWKGALNVYLSNLKDTNDAESKNTIRKCLEEIRFIFYLKQDLFTGEIDFIHTFYSPEIQDYTIIQLVKIILEKKPSICIKDFSFFSWMAKAAPNHIDDILEMMETLSQNTVAEDWKYFYGSEILTVITELFKEGESREISDQGQFLRRSLAIIERLQKKHVNLDDWYNNFERT
ncbi:ATP-binding protein [Akkermansia muciniphila]|uniref:ATP-binding protein n=1 Tax=Akkermansia muciniphila TaxID=239935 RepID=UPI000C9D2058|nr:ATP-binding protein [Akkermansia muciniphila]